MDNSFTITCILIEIEAHNRWGGLYYGPPAFTKLTRNHIDFLANPMYNHYQNIPHLIDSLKLRNMRKFDCVMQHLRYLNCYLMSIVSDIRVSNQILMEMNFSARFFSALSSS